MAEKNKTRDTAYRDQRDTAPSKQTGNINSRNNNVDASSPGSTEPNVEGANNEGIGDSALNDKKLTNYTSNHSADA